MNTSNTLPYSSLSATKCPISNSFSVKRRRSLRHSGHRKRKDFSSNPIKPSVDVPNSDSEAGNQLRLVLDFDQISQIKSLTSPKLQQFLSSAKDAYDDLKTLITFDDYNRIVFSCRRSTVEFTGVVLLWGFVVVFTFRLLIKLGLGLRSKLAFDRDRKNVVVRRDRSLGGREVVVARRLEDREVGVMSKSFRVLDNPLSSLGLEGGDWRSYQVRSSKKLPKWWPVSVEEPTLEMNQEEYKTDANRLIRAITDYRTRGNDFMADDIIRLRRICRASRVQVSFDTTNTCDAFYRASVDLVLNVCSSTPSYSTSTQIDGEDPRQFVAGLARNIGLENVRAARMVSAAVAARMHSCFLQSWALEVQGKHSDAILELSKICFILRTFPPDEASPEMEMVARGLGKHLNVEQRELLMNMFISVCSKENQRNAADALGLMALP